MSLAVEGKSRRNRCKTVKWILTIPPPLTDRGLDAHCLTWYPREFHARGPGQAWSMPLSPLYVHINE